MSQISNKQPWGFSLLNVSKIAIIIKHRSKQQVFDYFDLCFGRHKSYNENSTSSHFACHLETQIIVAILHAILKHRL